jgi:hypothetical protein
MGFVVVVWATLKELGLAPSSEEERDLADLAEKWRSGMCCNCI